MQSFILQVLDMKKIKIELTADEAKIVLFCLEKQKRKHIEVAEKLHKENHKPQLQERLKDLHLQLAKELQDIREIFLFEMFKKRIK